MNWWFEVSPRKLKELVNPVRVRVRVRVRVDQGQGKG
jgi:hypothetical protein